MTKYKEEDYLMLSGIQHFEFCQRQWALIHIEQQWEENFLTVEGNILHERAHDKEFTEVRGDLIISRGMAVFSRELGISGVCDVVEFHKDSDGIELFGRTGKYIPVPIEYKRGRPKEGDEDFIQLVCQAMCLEEMLCCDIEYGYMYYGEPKKRTRVNISYELRQKVRKDIDMMHSYYKRRYTPNTKYSKKCKSCSLKDICVPKRGKYSSVESYIKSRLGDDE